MTSQTERLFNPIDYGFKFTDDGWYTFDRVAATKAAKQARNAHARMLRRMGETVKTFSEPGQLITKGGIGSGHPQIEEIITIYGIR